MPLPVKVFFLLCISLRLHAQLEISELYPTPRKSIPLDILNCESGHFYMLRYNKMAHDITIERRRKSDAAISAFTPLKLDSVNASWFNYEHLDYLFFEKQGLLYFVFERVLNNQSKIYMKVIDTLGKSSGFIEVAELAAEKNENQLDLDFELTDDKLLQITRIRVFGPNVYKQVEVYDPSSRQTLFARRLPLENVMSGYSGRVSFDKDWNLYYLQMKFHFHFDVNYYSSYGDVINSRPAVDSVYIVALSSDNKSLIRKKLDVEGLIYIHTAVLESDEMGPVLSMMYSGSDKNDNETVRFLVCSFNKGLGVLSCTSDTLSSHLAERLTFYDGSDFDSPARKTYRLESGLRVSGGKYHFMERRDENYYKEMLVWRTCDSTLKVDLQTLIPRKIFFFSERVYYRKIGTAMRAVRDDDVFTFVLENRANARIRAGEFDFHQFRRQESARGGNLVAYVLRKSGRLEKKVVYQNREYNCIPLNYTGNRKDVVFYLVKNDAERFAVLQLNRL